MVVVTTFNVDNMLILRVLEAINFMVEKHPRDPVLFRCRSMFLDKGPLCSSCEVNDPDLLERCQGCLTNSHVRGDNQNYPSVQNLSKRAPNLKMGFALNSKT